jgi:hypothetical protein
MEIITYPSPPEEVPRITCQLWHTRINSTENSTVSNGINTHGELGREVLRNVVVKSNTKTQNTYPLKMRTTQNSFFEIEILD